MAFRKKSEIKRIVKIVHRSFESLGEMHKINKFEIIPKWFCSASGITISYYNMLHIYPTPCACTCCQSYTTPYEYANFFNKVAGLQLATLQKKGTHRNCFGYWLLKWIGKSEKREIMNYDALNMIFSIPIIMNVQKSRKNAKKYWQTQNTLLIYG